MKDVSVGDVFLWQGKLVQAQWMNQGHKSVGFVTNESVQVSSLPTRTLRSKGS
jgi:hypothetical protein